MDRRLLSIARDADPRYDLFLPRDAEAMLLVEFQGETPEEVRQRMQNVVVRMQRRKRLAFDSRDPRTRRGRSCVGSCREKFYRDCTA